MEADRRRTMGRRARSVALGLLAACASVAVAACVGASPTPEKIVITLPPSTPAATVAASDYSAGTTAPSASGSQVASTPIVSTTSVNQAANSRWSVSFQMPVVSGVADQTAQAMNDAITLKVNAYIFSFNGAGLPAVGAGNAPSTLKGGYSVAYVSDALLSLRFTVETDITGAAHPSIVAGSINFDVATGSVIQLPDLFTSPASALPVLEAQAHKLLTAELGADLNWPASPTMADFGGAWAFTKDGLELTWSQGAIADEASGPATISIGWPALSGVILKPGPAAGFLP